MRRWGMSMMTVFKNFCVDLLHKSGEIGINGL